MARIFAKIKCGIWTDDDFLDLEPEERSLLIASWSRPEVNNAGVAPWRPDEMTHLISRHATADDVRRVGAALQEKRYLLIDERTREVLMRSYVRHDDVVRQPKLAVAFVAAFESIKSPVLKQTIANELHRLKAEAHEDCQGDEKLLPAALRQPEKPGQRNRLLDLLRHTPATVPPEVLARWARGNRPVPVTPGSEYVEAFSAAVAGPPIPGADMFTDADDSMTSDLGGYPIDSLSEGYGLGSVGPIPTTTTTTTNNKKNISPRASTQGIDETPSEGDGDGSLPGLLLPLPVANAPTAQDASGDDGDGVDYTRNRFDEFWEAWNADGRGRARRGNKRAAFKAWGPALKRAGGKPERIIAEIGPAWNGATADQYVPYAEKWLREDRWKHRPVPLRDRDGTDTPLPRAVGQGAARFQPDPAPVEGRWYDMAAGQRL